MYRNGFAKEILMKNDLLAIKKSLSTILPEKRFYHTLGVEAVSFSLAARYESNTNQAALAGLLHDLARCFPDPELLKQCDAYHLPVSEVERRNPYLLHGKLGAYQAKEVYGITDSNMLSAIAYHTTGKPDMNLLEKIIFTADYIEPNRSGKHIPDLDEIRSLAFHDIDQAVYRILDNTLKYLESGTQEIDPLTKEAYNFYKQKINPGSC
ncbi:MAG: hypothetical protein K0S18_1104 [Anaerocolumna sp.]|jgi:predicted HD superfamily hydrolase involved in NAD metabolism|nr:hypothetical protein [Anaerocolumna sp.]